MKECGSKTVRDGKCEVCGQEVTVKREYYSKAQWDKLPEGLKGGV
jgi:hypothetical protein